MYDSNLCVLPYVRTHRVISYMRNKVIQLKWTKRAQTSLGSPYLATGGEIPAYFPQVMR